MLTGRQHTASRQAADRGQRPHGSGPPTARGGLAPTPAWASGREPPPAPPGDRDGDHRTGWDHLAVLRIPRLEPANRCRPLLLPLLPRLDDQPRPAGPNPPR